MRTQHPTEGFSCLAEKAHKVRSIVGINVDKDDDDDNDE